MSRRTGRFLKGALFGVLAGITAGVLFAPKAGKETREDIKKRAAELSDQANALYDKSKIVLDKKLIELKKVGDKIDKQKYTKLVEEVVKEAKNESEATKEATKELGVQLKEDWAKVESALKS